MIKFTKYIVAAFILLAFFTEAFATPVNITITTGEWPPYTSKDAPHNGFANHVIEEAFKEVGVTVTWGFMPWPRAKKLTAHGDWQASSLWLRTPSREKLFLFSAPVFEDRRVLIVRADTRLDWKSVTELHGKTIGVLLDTDYPYFFPILKEQESKILILPNYKTAFQALLMGRMDGMIAVDNSWQVVIKERLSPDILPRLKASSIQSSPLPFHLVVGKTLPSGYDIIKTFNAGIMLLKSSGRYDQLLADLYAGKYERTRIVSDR